MTQKQAAFSGRRWHDMGGDAAGPIPDEDHDFALWEKRIDALLTLCNTKGIFAVDGLRRVLEDLGPDSFETMTYYERWVMSLNQNLVERGIYTSEELGQKMTEVTKRGNTYGDAANG